MNDAEIERQLRDIIAYTQDAEEMQLGAVWADDVAEVRQMRDDANSGRMDWARARSWAKRGLDALAADDSRTAAVYLASAKDALIRALKSRIEPHDLEFLSRRAKKRGRPQKRK